MKYQNTIGISLIIKLNLMEAEKEKECELDPC
jgi:hypothetical protein